MLPDDFIRDPYLRLLGLVDHCNHAIKQGEWEPADVERFYALKDRLMARLHERPPRGAEVRLWLVPFLKRCERCKDAAGDAMRRDGSAKPFGHYLEQVPPCPDDAEVPDRASLEMEITHLGRVFCFHVPMPQAAGWGIATADLPRKRWIPGREFNHLRFSPVFDEIEVLLDAAG